MRSRTAVLALFLAFTVMPVRSAWAGWGVSFMQWLEHINPGPYTGVSGELNWCVPIGTTSCRASQVRSVTDSRSNVPMARFIASIQGGFAAELTKTDPLPKQTIVIPITEVLQYAYGPIGVGGGAGQLFVTRLPEQHAYTNFGVFRVSVALGAANRAERLSIQGDLYFLPGFDANTFGDHPATGAERRYVLSFVIRH